MKIRIENGTIVNEGRTFDGTIVIEGDTITQVIEGTTHPGDESCTRIDASGCFVLPGVIDTHVHFREPGLTDKADMSSESLAAAAGGVTSFFDMPNTVPQTTTLEALQDKLGRAAAASHVNYAFLFGATNDNAHLLARLNPTVVPAIKLFMGSSTGNMLVDSDKALDQVFAAAGELPIVAHCEDTAVISRNMAAMQLSYGEDPPLWTHPCIRSEEACLNSTTKAIKLAKRHQARLHVAHVSTASELSLIPAGSGSTITAEATVGHLLFSDVDYKRLGTRIKVNPAIKSAIDQQALRQALTDGRIATIATDHAPHLLAQKQGGAARAASGMPMVQFSLVAMLELADEGVLPITRVVQLMCHNPAQLFAVRQRGFLRTGYKADVAIVRPRSPWTVDGCNILSKCGWSPLEGHRFSWRVEHTLCNGHLVYSLGQTDTTYIGEQLRFR